MKMSAPFFNDTPPCEDADRRKRLTDARRCKDTFFENYTKNTGNAWIVRL